MITITIEVKTDEQLFELEKMLKEMGLKYWINKDVNDTNPDNLSETLL